MFNETRLLFLCELVAIREKAFLFSFLGKKFLLHETKTKLANNRLKSSGRPSESIGREPEVQIGWLANLAQQA